MTYVAQNLDTSKAFKPGHFEIFIFFLDSKVFYLQKCTESAEERLFVHGMSLKMVDLSISCK